MPKYYVEGIWPRRRVNLIAGASGAGKTRFSIPILFALLDGKPILGRRCDPMPGIAYIACDRTSEDAADTMSDMGYDPRRLFLFSFMDNELEWRLSKVVEVIPPGTNLTFIEAIGALVEHGKINDYHEVLRFGRQVNRAIRQSGSEIIGTTHVPKLKQDENFKHTRENIFGAASWAGFAGTIIVIDELPTSQRSVNVLTRDFPAERFTYEFNDNGHLVESSQVVGRTLMDRWLEKLPLGSQIETASIQEAGEHFKLSRATVTRWISDTCEQGMLITVSRGTYQKRPMQ